MEEEEPCVMERLNRVRFVGVPFALRKQGLRSTEASLVREVLQMLQGHSSSSFPWDDSSQVFTLRNGLYLSHASASSLKLLLTRFINAASCLRRTDSFVQRVRKTSCSTELSSSKASPTMQAFANAVSVKVKYLRKRAMEKEVFAVGSNAGTSITLVGLLSSLSRVCAGSEFLEQIVNEAVPYNWSLNDEPLSAAELGAQILSFLYNKMSEYCLVQDGEEEAYGTLRMLFAGTLQPLSEALTTWLHEGFLDDPFGELFFYPNNAVAIDDAAFWQNAFCLRYHKPQMSLNETRKHNPLDSGNSLALGIGMQSYSLSSSTLNSRNLDICSENFACPNFLQHIAKSILSAGKSLQLLQHVHHGVTNDGSSKNTTPDDSSSLPSSRDFPNSYISSCKEKLESINEACISGTCEHSLDNPFSFKHSWNQWRVETLDPGYPPFSWPVRPCVSCFQSNGEINADISALCPPKKNAIPSFKCEHAVDGFSFCQSLILPPLNDDNIYKSIFVTAGSNHKPTYNPWLNEADTTDQGKSKGFIGEALTGTDYGKGFGCGSLLVSHLQIDSTAMKRLFPASTVLPCSNEQGIFFGSNGIQLHAQFAVKMSQCLQKTELKVTQLPQMLVQECLINPIQKQVEIIGKKVLTKLMTEWRLMEELNILRAVYLVGSGDLLQQFSSVLFNKLDRGEPWDDFYELNTILQESIRSSADGVLLPALDSLVVVVQNKTNIGTDIGLGPAPVHIPGRNLTFGIDILDSLSFVYKVSWPLELIIDKNAIKKYNQVMTFLFKVKRAKFALDKACRWMWKDGVGQNTYMKQQLLLQQKLMHFVNTLHQYVMDRVLYSAWEELCQGMAMACSLDEVIACHDAYLISIQRQCLVAPDKLWALISSRVKTILSLALDFFSVQRTLFGGGAAPAIKARCQLEIVRIGRQFEECIIFLLRVLSFKLNVGHFPHLAELVTRINYNFYYVSESGHLLTPLPEVTNRKASQQANVSIPSHS